jgi:hypothetical protein
MVVATAGRESGDWTERRSWWMRSTWSRLAKAENRRGFSNEKRCSSAETQSSESERLMDSIAAEVDDGCASCGDVISRRELPAAATTVLKGVAADLSTAILN